MPGPRAHHRQHRCQLNRRARERDVKLRDLRGGHRDHHRFRTEAKSANTHRAATNGNAAQRVASAIGGGRAQARLVDRDHGTYDDGAGTVDDSSLDATALRCQHLTSRNHKQQHDGEQHHTN